MKKIIMTAGVCVLLGVLTGCGNSQQQEKFAPGKVINDSTEIIVSDSPEENTDTGATDGTYEASAKE